MRASEKLGSLVRMIIQVFSDLISFIAFQLVVLFAFAWAFFVLRNYRAEPDWHPLIQKPSALPGQLLEMFTMLLGDFDAEVFADEPAAMFLFILYQILVFVVMLHSGHTQCAYPPCRAPGRPP